MRGAETGAGFGKRMPGGGRRFLTQKSRRNLAQISGGEVWRNGRAAECASHSVPFSAPENGGLR